MVVSILQRLGLNQLWRVGEPLQSRADQNTRTAESGRRNGAAALVSRNAFQKNESKDKSGKTNEKNPDNKMRGYVKAGAARLLPNAIFKLPLRGDK